MVSIILFVRFKNEFLLQVSGLKFKARWSYLSIYKNYILLLLLSMQLLLKAFFFKEKFSFSFYIIYSNQRCNFFRFSLIPAPVSRQSARITSIATMHGILWSNHAMSHSAMQHHAIPNLKKRCLKIEKKNRNFNFPFSHILVHPHQSAKSYLTLFSVQFL